MKYGMMITGTIGAGYDWWSGKYGTKAQDVQNYLNEHPDEEVDIAVASPGGLVDEGLTIYQLIKDHGKVNIHILGMTASIATVLCMGAKSVDMSVGSSMMIHYASTSVMEWQSANKKQLDDLITKYQHDREDLDTIDKIIADVYAKKCGKKLDDVLGQMEKESWMSPNDALTFGLIDSVRDLDDDDKNHQNQFKNNYINSIIKDYGYPSLPSQQAVVDDDGNPTPNFLSKAVEGVKAIFRNSAKKIMNKKFTNIIALLKVDAVDQSDDKIQLTDAQVQTIEDRLVALDKEKTDASNALDAEKKKVVDMQKQIDDYKTSLAEKENTITDLNAAPGTEAGNKVVPEVNNTNSREVYNALKEIM